MEPTFFSAQRHLREILASDPELRRVHQDQIAQTLQAEFGILAHDVAMRAADMAIRKLIGPTASAETSLVDASPVVASVVVEPLPLGALVVDDVDVQPVTDDAASVFVRKDSGHGR